MSLPLCIAAAGTLYVAGVCLFCLGLCAGARDGDAAMRNVFDRLRRERDLSDLPNEARQTGGMDGASTQSPRLKLPGSAAPAAPGTLLASSLRRFNQHGRPAK